VLQRAKDRRRIWSSRGIASSVGISHQTAIAIMHENQFMYQSYNKQVKLTSEVMKERILFAREMKKRESDWGLLLSVMNVIFEELIQQALDN